MQQPRTFHQQRQCGEISSSPTEDQAAHAAPVSEDDESPDDIRLRWARKDAERCKRVKKRKKKPKKGKRSTKETIRENEKIKNKLLKYLYKNKKSIVDGDSDSSSSSSSSSDSDD
jgi:hypothetical protein